MQTDNVVKRSMIIGVAGASASGKSLVSKTIRDELISEFSEEQVGVISEDSYYKDLKHLPMSERAKWNFDHPNAFEHSLMIEHIQQLLDNKSVQIPKYSFIESLRLPDTVTFTPKKVIILEGILLLSCLELRQLIDIAVFMDTPLDICLIRRIKRDIGERGRTLESTLDKYENYVRPMYVQFIEPSKQHADIIVPRGGKNRIAVDLIKAKIRNLINNR